MNHSFRSLPALLRRVCPFAFLICLVIAAHGHDVGPEMYSGMRWRSIGPFRAGRVTSVSGVATQPSVYYAATPGGSLWKTTDAGQVWKPITDDVPFASIGAVAVAQSNPNVVYMGTGEQTQGNGVYKSTDAGATWRSIGLEKTHTITGLVVDPRNPDIVLVAAAGDATSGVERGVFKTTDGGKTWKKVLFKDNETAVMDLNMAPGNSKVLYATTLRRPLIPPDPDAAAPRQQDATIYKSLDEGSTWSAVEGKGLPTEPMGRSGVAASPGPTGRQVFAIVAQGVFRSDDAGNSWTHTTTDPRVIGNGYFSRIFVDPTNANTVYVAQTSMYRSADGGKTFQAWAGAPSGDDMHTLWINPTNSQYIILGVDQGAIVSSNGGSTWSSWYNQPTGQFYHVSTDNQFPYYIYAAQQDSGTVSVPNRSDYGEITYRDWAPIGGMEFAYITPDPLNVNNIYTGGWYGSVLRFDKTTGQLTHVFVRTPKYRTSNSPPIVFSPQDPHILYIGAQFVMETTDGGYSWREISPDLTQKSAASSGGAGPRGAAAGPVIGTIAASTITAGEMWVGTSNGLVQVSQDGQTWQDVTPPGLPARSTIIALEASRHDASEAFCVVNIPRDVRPYIYRTRDFGKSWQLVTSGLQDSAIARVVRTDPVRKGLLYAGTENGAYVSFDDGDHWKSLQLNLPTTSVRDLEVHGDDLVAATFGRSLWILDNVNPLRQMDPSVAGQETHLFEPAKAVRVRWDMNQDTPLPVETPAGKNPPEGAIIDYYLKAEPAGEIKLSIYDAENRLVREFSSIASPVESTPANAPSYWFAAPQTLSTTAGLNRMAWDLRLPPPKTLRYSYYGNRVDYIEYTLADHAVPGDTPRVQPQGPYVVPGTYWLALSVGGQVYKQPLAVTIDPRVHVSQSDLVQQLNTEKNISAQMAASFDGSEQGTALRAAIAERQKSLASNAVAKDAADTLKSLDEKVAAVINGSRTDLGLGPLNRELSRLATMIESSDARPAAPLQASVDQACQALVKKLAQWRELNSASIPSLNTLLQKYGAAALPVPSNIPSDLPCAR